MTSNMITKQEIFLAKSEATWSVEHSTAINHPMFQAPPVRKETENKKRQRSNRSTTCSDERRRDIKRQCNVVDSGKNTTTITDTGITPTPTNSTTVKEANNDIARIKACGDTIPKRLYDNVQTSTTKLQTELNLYCTQNNVKTTKKAFETLAVQYNLYTAPGLRGKNKHKIRGIILRIDEFIKAVKKLLANRIDRIQAQYPLDGKSVLAFPTRTCNQALWTAICHPKEGAPSYYDKSITKDKGPWRFPGFANLTAEENLVTFNKVIKSIHRVYNELKKGHKNCVESKNSSCSSVSSKASTEIEAWTSRRYEYLKKHEVYFGLNENFTKTKFIVPFVPEGRLLLWNGYHQTAGNESDENGILKKNHKGLLKTLIVDAAPKSVLPEKAWKLLYEINLSSITDVGEGAEWSRHGQHWVEYAQSKNISPGLPLHQLEPWMKRFFNPDAQRLEKDEPLVKNMLSNDDRFFLCKNGYVISSKAFFDTEYGDVNDEVALILRTHRNFAQYILFDRDGIKCSSNDQDIILNDELFERLLLKPQKVSMDLTGDEKKLYLKNCNYCSRFPKAPKSGLGPAGSSYGIPGFLRFQCYCALVLEKLYGEDCMVIPERIRIKAGTKWGFLHSDRRMLPGSESGPEY
eukprot:g13748.t1